MEVHHHPHVENVSAGQAGKKFKEYILEFLMIFLAVTLGFFAENLRENITDSRIENELAKELYTELKGDSAAVAEKLSARLEKARDMDYVAAYFRDSSLTSLPRNFYPAYTSTTYMINSYAFEPRDGILSQLRNSGSLRYLKHTALQKLIGDLSVCIANVRSRNDQEYQYFSNPIKAFLLKHFDFEWLNKLRMTDSLPGSPILSILRRYRTGSRTIDARILNIPDFNREEAVNMIFFYKQLLESSRTLQLAEYVNSNQKILESLRHFYSLK